MAVDRLNAGTRKLVYEYGWQIVAAMLKDGFRGSVGELEDILRTWRERKQEKWEAEQL